MEIDDGGSIRVIGNECLLINLVIRALIMMAVMMLPISIIKENDVMMKYLKIMAVMMMLPISTIKQAVVMINYLIIMAVMMILIVCIYICVYVYAHTHIHI